MCGKICAFSSGDLQLAIESRVDETGMEHKFGGLGFAWIQTSSKLSLPSFQAASRLRVFHGVFTVSSASFSSYAS